MALAREGRRQRVECAWQRTLGDLQGRLAGLAPSRSWVERLTPAFGKLNSEQLASATSHLMLLGLAADQLWPAAEAAAAADWLKALWRDAPEGHVWNTVRSLAGQLPRPSFAAAGKWNEAADPLIALHEQWLLAEQPALRRQRGVYYTPREVVQFLLDAVDHLLTTCFEFPAGLSSVLASGRALRLVDPACGAGTFLVPAVERLLSGRSAAGSAERVRAILEGFELLPASCAAAHLVVQRRLGFDAGPLDVVPQTALLPGSIGHGDADGGTPALAIVVGNPPYSNFGRRNRDPWIQSLLGDYKRGLGERKINLDDDFIKFIRWGQQRIDRAGAGVLAFLTSNTYLDGLTHRRMRRSLRESFDEIYVLDLHGSAKRRETAPGGGPDENLFDIATGLALAVFVKLAPRADFAAGTVRHAERWGTRRDKLAWLRATRFADAAWSVVEPACEEQLFVPHTAAVDARWQLAIPLDELFEHFISGVQTKRDALFVDWSPEELATRLAAEWCELGREATFDCRRIQPYFTAPFDRRSVYYDPPLLGRARYRVMRHMLRDNVGLVFMRRSTNGGVYDHFLVVDGLISDRFFYSAHGTPYLAPWYLDDEAGRRPNLARGATERLQAALGRRYVWRRHAGDESRFDATDVLAYAYATFHAPSYRERFAEPLRRGFPRVPLPREARQFRRLGELGRRLVRYHLLRETGPEAACSESRLPPPGPAREARRSAPGPSRSRLRGRPPAAGISRVAWQMRVGGYPVLPRWFQQRRDRTLSAGELSYARRVARALEATQLLLPEIDAALSLD